MTALPDDDFFATLKSHVDFHIEHHLSRLFVGFQWDGIGTTESRLARFDDAARYRPVEMRLALDSMAFDREAILATRAHAAALLLRGAERKFWKLSVQLKRNLRRIAATLIPTMEETQMPKSPAVPKQPAPKQDDLKRLLDAAHECTAASDVMKDPNATPAAKLEAAKDCMRLLDHLTPDWEAQFAAANPALVVVARAVATLRLKESP